MWRRGLVARQHVGSSRTRDRTRVPCIGRWILNHQATREIPVFIFLTKATLDSNPTFVPELLCQVPSVSSFLHLQNGWGFFPASPLCLSRELCRELKHKHFSRVPERQSTSLNSRCSFVNYFCFLDLTIKHNSSTQIVPIP